MILSLLATTDPAELFRLPVSDPVVIFALAMTLFVLAPLFFERFRVPGIIGLIVAGAVIGPHGLGLMERDETIVLLGTVGLLYLMFLAGVEIDLQGFSRNRNRSVVFGAITYVIPQVVGTALGRWLGYGWPASILLGSLLASHTLLAYPIASRLGISRNVAVTSAVGGTIITDLVALLVLAVIAAGAEGELGAAFWLRLTVSLAVFAGLVLWGLPRLGRWFFRHEEDGETGAYVFILAALFVSALLAQVAGVEAIIGAFLAGLALNRLVPEGSPLNNRIHFFGNAVFIPFFLLSVGMLVDVRVLTGSAQAWKVMAGMTATVVFSKWAAAQLTRRIYGYSADEAWTVFGLTVPQAAATLAAALIGFRIELLDAAVLNGTIMMILATCTVGPWVVERYGRRLALQEERQPYRPSEAPQRILIPIGNPQTAPALLDVAFLVRAPGSEEPVLPISVVHGDQRGSAARVAEAEKRLRDAVMYAAGADVPVVPLTRVDHSYAGGIIRGMAESRTTTVVAGWDGRRSRRAGILSDVLDQILARTEQLAFVARARHPLNTTRRILLVLPPYVDRSRGFYDAVRHVKQMANRLGADLLAMVVEGEPESLREALDSVKPEVPTTLEPVSGWSSFPVQLKRLLKEGDLVVAISSRRGTVAWQRELDQLPRRLENLVERESFVVVYPCEAEAPEDERPAVLPRALSRERVVLDLPARSFEEAVEGVLRTEFAGERLREIRDDLVREARHHTTELVPGVVFPSARVEGLPEPMVFLGVVRNAVPVPNATGPARVLFLLVSPPEQPQDHLRYLSEVARLVGSAERMERLCTCESPDVLFDWFRPTPEPAPRREGEAELAASTGGS